MASITASELKLAESDSRAAHWHLALRLAADADTPVEPAPVEPVPAADGELDPRVTDFAREHRAELYTSDEDVPTRLRDLKTLVGPIGPHVFYVPELLSGADFSEPSVEVASYQGFMKEYEDHPGVYPVVGSHNSFAVAIRLNVMNDTMLQVFEALQEGSAPGEEAAGPASPEAQETAWSNWVAGQFEQTLAEKFPDFSETIEDFSDEHLKALFESIRKRTGVEWVAEGPEDATIDVARITEGAIPEDFKNAPTPKDEPKTLEDTVNPEPEQEEEAALPAAIEALEPVVAAKQAAEEVPEPVLTAEPVELDDFTKAYIEAAFWSSMDESDSATGGNPLDKNYGIDDLDEATKAQMITDCQEFQEANGALLTDENYEKANQWDTIQHAGHDFWLTRNGHGAGFWDGDWKEPAATTLNEASKKFGEFDLYVGDDGKIYHQ